MDLPLGSNNIKRKSYRILDTSRALFRLLMFKVCGTEYTKFSSLDSYRLSGGTYGWPKSDIFGLRVCGLGLRFRVWVSGLVFWSLDPAPRSFRFRVDLFGRCSGFF